MMASVCMAQNPDKTDLMVQKAVQKAEELGIKISVAIVDAHGNLKAFKRMDGAVLASIQTSQGKAYTSAAVPVPTGDLAEMNGKIPGHPFSHLPGFVMIKGGVPINEGGAIGIGGGSGEQDEECALAAMQ